MSAWERLRNSLGGGGADVPSIAAEDELRERSRHWRANIESHAAGLAPPVDPGRDHLRGWPDAAVILVEYGDYASAACRDAARFVSAGPPAGEVCFAFRHFPIADAHPTAVYAAEAAEAAASQGRFWEMHDRLLARGQEIERHEIRVLAERLGLDLERFDADLLGSEPGARVPADFDSGVASGVNGSPTFFLNGERFDWDGEPESLDRAVRQAGAGERFDLPAEAAGR